VTKALALSKSMCWPQRSAAGSRSRRGGTLVKKTPPEEKSGAQEAVSQKTYNVKKKKASGRRICEKHTGGGQGAESIGGGMVRWGKASGVRYTGGAKRQDYNLKVAKGSGGVLGSWTQGKKAVRVSKKK